MRHFATLLLAGACTLVATIAQAEDALLSSLAGFSVDVSYSEIVGSRRGTFAWTWKEKIYISSKLRFFTKHSVQGDSRSSGRSADISPDEGGTGSETPFKWNGSGLSRQWINMRGNFIQQTITIRPTSSGFDCQMV